VFLFYNNLHNISYVILTVPNVRVRRVCCRRRSAQGRRGRGRGRYGVNQYLRALSSPAAAASGPRTSPSPRSVSSASTGTRSDRFDYSPIVASPSPVKKRSLFNGLLSSAFSRLSPNQHHPSPTKPVVGSRSVSGTTRALKATVVRLPVSDGAMVGNITLLSLFILVAIFSQSSLQLLHFAGRYSSTGKHTFWSFRVSE
jgi:hypothetical protein